jgi:hypothetical protein
MIDPGIEPGTCCDSLSNAKCQSHCKADVITATPIDRVDNWDFRYLVTYEKSQAPGYSR